MSFPNKKPRPVVEHGYRGRRNFNQKNYTVQSPRFHREKKSLPSPSDFYRKQFPGLRVHGDWALTRCCFHDDGIPSLGVNLVEGHFNCHACGVAGGGIVDFHIKKTGSSFRDAIQELEAGRW